MYCNPVAFHRVLKFSSNSSNSVCERHVSRDIKTTKTNLKYKILFNTNDKKKFNKKNKSGHLKRSWRFTCHFYIEKVSQREMTRNKNVKSWQTPAEDRN